MPRPRSTPIDTGTREMRPVDVANLPDPSDVMNNRAATAAMPTTVLNGTSPEHRAVTSPEHRAITPRREYAFLRLYAESGMIFADKLAPLLFGVNYDGSIESLEQVMDIISKAGWSLFSDRSSEMAGLDSFVFSRLKW